MSIVDASALEKPASILQKEKSSTHKIRIVLLKKKKAAKEQPSPFLLVRTSEDHPQRHLYLSWTTDGAGDVA